ncbi:SAM-dependent methyltransferase, partial [Streptomyces sp. SID14478]|nr:SAM-dependent methyltransferase [Streptomyces sp. SID14478]
MRTGEDRIAPTTHTAVDPGAWPDIATPPTASRARTALAGAVVRRALHQLPLR